MRKVIAVSEANQLPSDEIQMGFLLSSGVRVGSEVTEPGNPGGFPGNIGGKVWSRTATPDLVNSQLHRTTETPPAPPPHHFRGALPNQPALTRAWLIF